MQPTPIYSIKSFICAFQKKKQLQSYVRNKVYKFMYIYIM